MQAGRLCGNKSIVGSESFSFFVGQSSWLANSCRRGKITHSVMQVKNYRSFMQIDRQGERQATRQGGREKGMKGGRQATAERLPNTQKAAQACKLRLLVTLAMFPSVLLCPAQLLSIQVSFSCHATRPSGLPFDPCIVLYTYMH